ncbi:hypothetical protein CAPTEDRAFT_198874 [Capitella teleta]|uniref:G-protein coupled receptors family 1 profile domain-containing protein n=1 Tax=Capitella teleta TaxID=283909 RepID=R7T7U5_CAPTE|nr:hypothetical protein CAPTEDRAFT_198874 [Capitella teleta]|eukprot:ELT87495.1 hypothetical protein CAPTEDRAFT_198874 [Capitella teleta]
MTVNDSTTAEDLVSALPLEPAETHLLVIQTVFLSVLMLVVISGNAGLICVIACTQQLRSVTHAFIVSLALSDMLVGVVIIPINFAIPTAMFHGYTTCMYAACFTVVVALSSIANIFAVSIDRYLAVAHPLRYRSLMTPRNASIAISTTWVVSIILGFLPLMGWRVTSSTCLRGETYHPGYVLLIFACGCLLPAWGSALIYAKVFAIAKETNQKITDTTAMATGWRMRSNRKTLKTIAILMLYFQLSWLPVFISMVTDAFVSPRLLPSWAHALFGTLAFVNSALDPLIYGYRNRDIRRSAVKCVTGLVSV